MSRLLRGFDKPRPSPLPTPPLLLDGVAAAAYLGLSEREFHRLRAAGAMQKPRRVPGRATPMWHRGDLDEWAAKLGRGDALPARRGEK